MKPSTQESARAPRICHCTSGHSSGDTRIFHKECRSLAKAGYNVTLVARHDGPAESDGVRFRPIRRGKSRWSRWVVGAWRVWRIARAEPADAYHFHDPELIPIGLLLRWRTGARIVYDMHEYYSEVIPARRGQKRLLGLSRWFWNLLLERLPLRWYDGVVFPTTPLAAEFGTPDHSVTLLNLPHGVHACDAMAEQRSAAPKDYDVVFVGSVAPPRMRVMLDVAERLAEQRGAFRWLFVGLDPYMQRWVQDQCSPEFINRHLEMVGKVPYEQVLAYLSRSRVGFNYHGMEKRFLVAIPVKVFEYLLMEVPTVTSALPELTRVLRHGEHALLVESDDPNEYVRAIASLLDDEAAACAMGKAGRALVRDKLNWESSEAPKLVAFYEHLLREKCPCPKD